MFLSHSFAPVGLLLAKPHTDTQAWGCVFLTAWTFLPFFPTSWDMSGDTQGLASWISKMATQLTGGGRRFEAICTAPLKWTPLPNGPSKLSAGQNPFWTSAQRTGSCCTQFAAPAPSTCHVCFRSLLLFRPETETLAFELTRHPAETRWYTQSS